MQRRVVDSKSRVIVLFEGRGSNILGRSINGFMNMLEPRGTKYTHFESDVPVDPRNMLRYLSREPADGQIAIYDNSWYSRIMDLMSGSKDTSEFIRGCLCFEKYLVDNDIVLVKIFLDAEDDACNIVPKSKRTFLDSDGCKTWSSKNAMSTIASTSTSYAPWDLIKGDDVQDIVSDIAETFLARVARALDEPHVPETRTIIPILPNPREDVDLTLEAPKGYRRKLEELTEELSALQVRLAASKRSIVLVFEGWDAAGKGGSIRRVTNALNPRGYYVKPVAAPIGEERLHSYLWRFAVSMPKAGHIVIFDRSWYGRMMVEPIEGFCDEGMYSRAPEEIRNFEKNMVDAGAIVIKFWLEVSSDEQLRRFRSRQEDPAKNYKITDEDWRNREKWDVYEEYIDRMISSTNTPYAPWVVVESEDKKYGRLKVMRTIVDALHAALD